MKKKFSRRCERDFHVKIVGSEKSWIRPKKISLESNVGPLAIAGALGGLICAIYICTHSPLLEVTNLIGVLVAIFQAATQIQEQTLAFTIKLVAVTLTLMFFGTWLGAQITGFALNIFTNFAEWSLTS